MTIPPRLACACTRRATCLVKTSTEKSTAVALADAPAARAGSDDPGAAAVGRLERDRLLVLDGGELVALEVTADRRAPAPVRR
jgi:hypothetical protein